MEPDVHYRVYKIPLLLIRILSHINPMHIFIMYFFKPDLNIFQSDIFPFDSKLKFCSLRIFHLPIHAICPAHLNIFDGHKNALWRVQIMAFLLQFYSASCHVLLGREAACFVTLTIRSRSSFKWHNNSVRSSTKTQHFYITEISWSVLFVQIIFV
jgi:hypothetical protein